MRMVNPDIHSRVGVDQAMHMFPTDGSSRIKTALPGVPGLSNPMRFFFMYILWHVTERNDNLE